MSKTKSARKTVEQKSFLNSFEIENYIPQKYHVPMVLGIIFVLFMIFLYPMYFGGKTFQSGDILASKAMVPYVLQDRDGFSLWNPLIFCGMPAYLIGVEFSWFNLIYVGFSYAKMAFGALWKVDYAVWSFYLILLGLTTFLFMKELTKNTLVSLFTAISTSFSTGLIVFLFIGHVTKLTSLAFYPLLFLLLFRMQRKIRWLDFFLLVITLQLFIQGFHLQIIFYTLLSVGIYFAYYFIRAVVKKEIENRNSLLKSGLVFAVAIIIAVLIQSDNLTQTYEYTQYSTRGEKGILEQSAGETPKSSSDYYAYHTNWSFSPQEIMTFIIPSYYGFGTSVYNGPLTQDKDVEVNTYFGQMPFVDVAMYMGVIVFFLALFAIVTRWRDPFVQFLTILSGVSILISFGNNFPILFDLFFYYLPQFDKFRVPSMILVLLQLTFPVLAGFGLMKIISLRKEADQWSLNILKYSGFALAGIFAASVLLNNVLSDWFVSRVNAFAAALPSEKSGLAQQFQALSEYMGQMFVGDFMIAFGFSAAVFLAGFFYVNKRISADVLVIIVIILSTVDLWRIDARGAKYIDQPDIEGLFDVPDYITAIKNQKDKDPFRMLNIKQDGSIGSFNQNSNYNAHFLVEDFYGYSGVKPRGFQDLMDVVGPANKTLWSMANVKYVVTESPVAFPGLTQIYQGEKSVLYKNEFALPRLFMVNKVEKSGGLDVLNRIKADSFIPTDIAYVQDKEINVDEQDSTASLKIKSYNEAKIEASVIASGNSFVVFSTSYMPAGWNAYIDGKPTEIYRTNHAFMGIEVPKGNHVVVFEYLPKSWVISKYVALFLSSFTVFGAISVFGFSLFKRRKA